MAICSIIVPCYNEEECLPASALILKNKLLSLLEKGLCSEGSHIVFVDDGSKDSTWSLIESLHEEDRLFEGVKLSRNEGHQYALMAGLEAAVEQSDVTISIDADLQDDVNAMDEMLLDYQNGCDIVYGVRTSRKSDTFFKRTTAQGYYRFMHKMGVEIVNDSADSRFMSKRATFALLSYEESNLFLRGIVPLIGYKSGKVGYERHERTAGVSKYPLKKMLALAWNGITSFSTKPLSAIYRLGFLILFLSVIEMTVFGILFGVAVLSFNDLPFILGSIFTMGALILLAIGIVGEYVGKINIQVKKRPHYFIEKILK